LDELLTLLALIRFNPEMDRLWFVGDLVNRGPKSLEVLRFVKALGDAATVVLGNHDLHLLAANAGVIPHPEPSFSAILAAPERADLVDWLKTRPLLYHDPHLNYALVHAGIPPEWDLHEALEHAALLAQILQGPKSLQFLKKMYGDTPNAWAPSLKGMPRWRYVGNALTRMRFCDPLGKLKLKADVPVNWGMQSPRLIPWFKHPSRKTKGSRIIFGHWAALGGTTLEQNVYALDTGCVWGGFLTAMRLEDQARFAVPSRLNFSPHL
jgi:bis(5'-nucleosyl)-tetraphosphatase (symmetrical)